MHAALVALVAATITILPTPAAPAENDQFSPQVGVAVDPTLSLAPSFAFGRVCLPGSTCPAQIDDHSAVVLCMRAGLVPEKAIDLPFFNFPGGPIPSRTQVVMFFAHKDAQCPE